MKTSRFLLACATVAAGFPLVASAQSTTTGTLQAKITITSNCVIAAGTTDLDFSSHASTETAPATADNGGFSVTCTNQTPYSIGLQSTASGSAKNGTGAMKSADAGITQTVGYQLYQDSARATVWGNETSGSVNTKSATGSGSAQTYVVYGATTTTLNVPASTYADTVQINVYY